MKKDIRTLAALLIASATFVACSNDESLLNEQPVNPTQKYTMTVNASKGDNVTTRALSLSGKTLSAKWAATDGVAVLKEDWSATLGTLTAAASETNTTSLTGDLDAAPTAGDNLKLLFPRDTWEYTGQTGVLLSDANSIEKKYDYALADVTVKKVDGSKITTTGDAAFASQQAIVKFILQDNTGTDLPVTSLNIATAGGKLVQSRAYSAGGWTPSACEDYDDSSKPYYIYLELPYEASMMFDVYPFNQDQNFGTSGCKQVGGKYIYRLVSSNDPGTTISKIRAFGSGGFLDARNVPFTNGAYYTYVDQSNVSTTIPAKSDPGIKSTYGTLTVTPASETNTLTVALRNELGAADTYKLMAVSGSEVYTFNKSGVTFENGKYYEITVKMKPGTPLADATVGMLVGSNGKAYDAIFSSYMPAGFTAAGMVAYKSGSNGLVIALTDEAGELNWETANGASGAAGHTPTVTGYSWRLPTKEEWPLMFGANGGNNASYSGLNTAIGNAGGTALVKDWNYWTSTPDPGNVDFYYKVSLFNPVKIEGTGKTWTEYVRAVFDF